MEANSLLPDPDLKVHMSLDEIIHLTGPKNSRGLKTRKKKKRNSKKREEEQLGPEHSVPLHSSPAGLGIYVSKQSPLLNAENRRRITQAISNRAVNSDLLQKTKEIIPAEYILIRTEQGVERVLVPAASCLTKPRQKLLQPRKLNKTSNRLSFDVQNEEIPDAPPPLVAAPIFQPPSPKEQLVEPEIVVLDPPIHKKHFEVIDVESNLPVDVEGEKLYVPAPLSLPQSCGRSLHDRFTMLSQNRVN